LPLTLGPHVGVGRRRGLMLKDKKTRRLVLAVTGGALIAIIGGALLLQDQWFRIAIHPPGEFASTRAPERPDYAKAESWALRPAQPPPGAWEKPWGVDIFFIHPTSAYAGDDWNADITDAAANKRLEERILPNHAGPFLQAGPVYAPRYRQAALYSEVEVGGESDGAFLISYNDILASFDQYMAANNRGRGVILAGVGQGGLYVQRLLADRFQADPLKQRLAAAYVIDAALPADAPGAMFPQPVCKAMGEIQCVVAWKTIVDGENEKAFRERSPVWTTDWKIAPSKGKDFVCVNPLTWTTDEQLAPKVDHRGGAKATNAADLMPTIIPQAVSTRCRNGVLDVERASAPELKPSGEWGGRYKTPEMNLFYADIIANVTQRATNASIWLDANAPKPAEPLPPQQVLEDAPIHREGGEPVPVPQEN
jgi:DUF3089 family protein